MNSRGPRPGNHVEVREAIEPELQNICDGKKTVKDGLDAAILREFSIPHGPSHPGEI